jgi:hypothetical protein
MGLSGVNILNAMGAGGSLYANDTAAHAGTFTSIQFTEDSVLSAYVGKVENVSALISDGITFSQGQVIYGECSSFTLASGSCLAYKS